MVNVKDFGAVGDGITKDTVAIQKAIDAGGLVHFPPGTYLSGSLHLKSNGGLFLEPGAILLGSPDKEDYNADDFCSQNRPYKAERVSGAHLINAVEQENVIICGSGRIDGNRQNIYGEKSEPGCECRTDKFDRPGDDFWRPGQMLFICECRNVQIRDVQLYNSTYWTCFLHGCEDVQIRGVRILNDQRTPNGDGIDIDCCCRVTVSDCIIDSGDDCITLRGSVSPLKKARACEYVTITNCVLHTNCNGFRIGVGKGIIRNVAISNIVFYHCTNAISINSNYSLDPTHGVEISNISFTNLQLEAERAFIINSQVRGSTPEPPAKDIRDIRIYQVRGTIRKPSLISGSAGLGMYDIMFKDVVLDIAGDLDSSTNHEGPWGSWHPGAPECVFYISHADGVTLDHVKVNWKKPVTGWTYGILAYNCKNIKNEQSDLGRPDLLG